MKHILTLWIVSLLAVPCMAADWKWQLPADRYKGLNQFERAQYDKAAKLYEQGAYAAAAAEFEKFKVQFEDSDETAYILLMQGMSLHNAKNRNAAIKVYQDVIDYFGSNEKHADDVIAATYWMGVAHLDSGEMLKGLRVMKALVENEKFKTHVLTCGALRRLADNYYNNNDFDLAIKYWRQAIRDFRKLNDEEVKYATSNYAALTIVKQDYKGYDSFFMDIADEKQKADPAYRKRFVEDLYDRGFGLYHWHEGWRWRKVWPLDKDETKHAEKYRAETKAFYEYIRAAKPAYEGAKDLWGYYDHCVQILCQTYTGDKAEREKVVQEAVAWLKTQGEDKKTQDNRYARLIDYLNSAREFDRARYVKTMMNDKLSAEYEEADILYSEGKAAEAVKVLAALEASGNAEQAERALQRRAWLLKEILRDYDNAIKAFSSMTNPPHNLWQIAECYLHWSGQGKDQAKLKLAMAQLAEIEASFPDWAPRAAWHMASWYDHCNDKKNACAHARRVLKQYPKSGESSQAHQLLEKYGISETGGGVGEEIK